MKILIVSSLFPPYIFGGAEVVAYNMAVALVAKGHEVHVVKMLEKEENDKWAELMPEGFFLYTIKTSKQHTLFERTNCEFNKVDKLLWHIKDHFDPTNIAAWDKLIMNIKPDHINIHNIMGFGFNVLPILGNGDASVTYVLHDLGLVCFNTTMYKITECNKTCINCLPTSLLRQSYLKKVKRLGLVSPSSINFNKIQKSFNHIKHVPKLILHNMQANFSNEHRYKQTKVIELVYVGRLNKLKGIDFLLDVLSQLSEEFSFHLNILGTGPDEAKLKELYSGCSWVHFVGFVSIEEVTNYLVMSDFYIIPSLMAEPYGMSTALALKVGTPVIGSNVGGTTELIHDGVTGLLIDAGNYDDWLSNLKVVFKNPSMIKEFRQNAQNFSNQFNNEEILIKFERFIVSL